MCTDTAGRPYATVVDTKVGDTLQADGGFTCLLNGECARVADKDGVLAIPCSEGWHTLDGQISSDGRTYVGLYPVQVQA